jgi:hypothetical protein
MSDPDWIIDPSKIDERFATEALRQAELLLQSQFTAATAADQRAMAAMGIYGSAAVAIVAAVLALFASSGKHLALEVSGSFAAALFFVSAFMAGYSCLPSDFFSAGSGVENLKHVVGQEMRVVLLGLAENIEERVRKNSESMEIKSAWFTAAQILGALAIPLAIFVYWRWL